MGGAFIKPQMSWRRLEVMAQNGKIEGLSADFKLAAFAIEIEDRILSGNYEPPTPREVDMWMCVHKPAKAPDKFLGVCG